MDAAILWLTSRLMRESCSWQRWLAAALLGAGYATAASLLPYHMINSVVAKLLCSACMVYFYFRATRWMVFFKQLASFYLAAFAVGGTGIGLWNIFRANAAFDFSLPTVEVKYILSAGALVIGAALLLLMRERLRKQQQIEEHLVDLACEYLGERIELKGLLDTGHTLKEVSSGGPVVCVALSCLTPKMANQVALDLPELTKLSFQTLGGQGRLPIFHPDQVTIRKSPKQIWRSIPNCWIGLTYQPLSADDLYQALVPATVAEEFNENRKEVKENGDMASISEGI
jgi:sigma-E processing peptidase SpoIIGA